MTTIKRAVWTTLLILTVMGQSYLYSHTGDNIHLGIVLLLFVPMVLWGFWTYDLLAGRGTDERRAGEREFEDAEEGAGDSEGEDQ